MLALTSGLIWLIFLRYHVTRFPLVLSPPVPLRMTEKDLKAKKTDHVLIRYNLNLHLSLNEHWEAGTAEFTVRLGEC